MQTMENGSVEHVVESVLKNVEGFAGKAEQADDITILSTQYLGAAARQPHDGIEITIKNRLSEIGVATEKVDAFMKEHNLSEEVRSKIAIILDELLNNTISYGYRDKDEHDIEIGLDRYGDRLIITLKDDGAPFDPFKYAEPDVEVSTEKRQIGGLGIHIVRNLLEKFSYKRSEGKNVVTLTKYIETQPE
jgi:sigma-B regulation protein RsbU (phosphoserine phosphatase)